MRRPSPLPPPPSQRDEPVPSPSSGAGGPSGPSGADDVEVAPILSFGGSRDDVAAGEAAPTPAAPEPEPGADNASPGWRGVWRAARARRRALRAEMRRFTVRQRRRRAVWVGTISALIALVVVTVGAAYSPLFAVERIRVVGTQSLDAAAVEEALAAQIGTPMPLVDESAVKATLVTFPLVETYTLEARPPHELVVRIVERTPIGVVEGAAGFTLVDAAGVALSTTPDAPEGEPVLDVAGGADSAAFEAVGHVMRSLPASIRPQVTAVSATSADDVTLTLGATDTDVVWGNAEDSALKAVVLDRQMAVAPPDTVSFYDVSSPEAVVVG